MEIISEINSFQAMFMLGAAAASALLGVVAIGLWTLILSSTGRASRRAENAADQLESTTLQLQEYIERSAAVSLPKSAGVDTQQAPDWQKNASPLTAPADPGLEDGSGELEDAVEDRLKEIINQRWVSQLAQGAARSEGPTAN